MSEGFTYSKYKQANNKQPDINDEVLQRMIASDIHTYTLLVDSESQDSSMTEITGGAINYLRASMLSGVKLEGEGPQLLGITDPMDLDTESLDGLAERHAERSVYRLDSDKDNIKERMLGGGILMVFSSENSDLHGRIARIQARLRQEAWTREPAKVAPTKLRLTTAHRDGARSHANASMQFIAEQVNYEGIMNFSDTEK